jgi:hypothetical protein
MQIGTWLRTSKRWKKTGERDTIAWQPKGRLRNNPHRGLSKWLTLFLEASRKPAND